MDSLRFFFGTAIGTQFEPYKYKEYIKERYVVSGKNKFLLEQGEDLTIKNIIISDLSTVVKQDLLKASGIDLHSFEIDDLFTKGTPIHGITIDMAQKKLQEILDAAIFLIDTKTIERQFPTYDLIKWNKNKDNWIAILARDDALIAYAMGNITGTQSHIEQVEVHPMFRGQHLCTRILKYAIQELVGQNVKSFYIMNGSTTLGGIPACSCYYSAPKSLNLQVFDEYNNTQFTDETCRTIPVPTFMRFEKI